MWWGRWVGVWVVLVVQTKYKALLQLNCWRSWMDLKWRLSWVEVEIELGVESELGNTLYICYTSWKDTKFYISLFFLKGLWRIWGRNWSYLPWQLRWCLHCHLCWHLPCCHHSWNWVLLLQEERRPQGGVCCGQNLRSWWICCEGFLIVHVFWY